MPWTVADVPSFTKKAKTAAQKRKWVSIANRVLADCQKSGGSDCEGRAIRVANSKFSEGGFSMPDKVNKVPKGAVHLMEGDEAFVKFAEGEDGSKVPKLKMVGYSGGVIKGHWYWNDLAIDLEGGKFTKQKYPILEDHMTSKKIAWIKKPTVENGKLVAPEDAVFLDTPEAEQFIKNSGKGFPYQSSIYARPTRVERLEEDASTKVNGITLRNSGQGVSVWREWEFKEMSVCVFGQDDKTQASAFSKDEMEEVEFEEVKVNALSDDDKPKRILTKKEVKTTMNLEKLKAEHPDLYQQIVDEGQKLAEDAFKEKESKLTSEIETLRGDNTKLSEQVTELVKRDAIRTEKENRSQAANILNSALAESSIAVRLHEKVRSCVNVDKFIKDEVLDVEAFTEAVDAEIKNWEELLPPSTVQGSGSSQLSVDDAEEDGEKTKLAEQDDANVDRLLKLAGQKTEE